MGARKVKIRGILRGHKRASDLGFGAEYLVRFRFL